MKITFRLIVKFLGLNIKLGYEIFEGLDFKQIDMYVLGI